MKVTPHLSIETMQRLQREQMWRSTQALLPLARLCHSAVLFDFGRTEVPKEHKDFALDLFERGLFTLPFPVTAFCFEGIPSPNEHVAGQQPAGAMMLLSQRDGQRGITAIQFTEMRYSDGRSAGAVPVAAAYDTEFSVRSDGAADVTSAVIPILDDRMMRLMYGHHFDQVLHDRMCGNAIQCMGLTVMLMSKGVETVHHPEPTRLNKSRALKKKPPIGESYTVRINLDGVRTIHTAGGDEDITGHTRKTPRMHWRRGHFRTLDRGGEQRIVPVAPSLVAAGDGDVAQRIYQVTKRGAR